ncbi:hypothetical protein PGIN_YH522_01657 [Porphyromonas gingivalis]|uniref:Family 10 glycosylhydrolase n=1 Tax=Porphyromonas gingivalis TaxID=837 RepID=A0AAF0BGC8_PORGN|nr:family 10 glycosylhydrolase [Porphyromonas gingivalis]WCG03681.1 family 10 glycosylhydrolase [Porphyromonas gingivalis]SJL31840.1 hypothetical protein PGIN_ATCC49417_01481 [Porphyromonas gingivalis]SJL33839.1 hypothetical protein PGIN_YH522_01657 [Porphyromonas gingivalis]
MKISGLTGWFVSIAALLFAGCGTKKVAPSPPTVKPLPDTVIAAPVIEPWVSPVREEMRGVWLTTIYGLDWPQRSAPTAEGLRKQREELCRILDRLKREKFNTVFFQVRHRGDVIYPSEIEPQSTIFTGAGKPDYDPLEFALKECHKRGLTFHAWLIVTPLGPDKHIRSLKGESVKSRHPEWCVRHNNLWYLNPGVPEARAYFASLVREIVEKYPVDGIHLDYMRYPEKAKIFDDAATYKQYGGNMDPAVWRRRNLSDLMADVHRAATEKTPWVQVSVATIGRLRKLAGKRGGDWTAYEGVHQDPVVWAQEGSVDFLVPMLYYRDDLFYPFLEDWKAQLPDLPIIPGLATYRVVDNSQWPAQVIGEQIDSARHMGFPGVCLFREDQLRHESNGIPQIIRERFAEDVVPIPIHRKGFAAPIKAEIPRLTRRTDGKIAVSWDKAAGETAVVYYRLFLRRFDTSGRMQDRLVADRIEDNSYLLPKELTVGATRIEVRLQAINKMNEAGPVSASSSMEIK